MSQSTPESIATADQPTPPDPAPPRRSRRPLVMAGLAAAVLAGAFFGFRWWQDQHSFVSTNDAQVKGDVVSVSPKIPGRLLEVRKHAGDHVTQGELVAELDPTEIKIQLQQAEANLAAARAGLGSSETGVSLQAQQTTAQQAQAQAAAQTARRNLQAARVARDRAAADQARLEVLFREGGVSRQQMDAARSAVLAATAQVQAAESQVRSAEAGVSLAQTGETQVRQRQQAVEASRAQIAQAEAAVAAARQQLANTRLHAPLTGEVAQVHRLAGENIQPGQPVMAIVGAEGIYVNAFVEETKIAPVKVGQPVRVEIDAFSGRDFAGRVADIGPAAGSEFALIPQNTGSGNFTKVVQRLPVKIRVEDPQGLLRPGMSATVHIDVREAR